MKRPLPWLAVLLALVLRSPAPAQSAPRLEQVLPRVQEHVQEFELKLPDFICDETITSRELMGGHVEHETVIDSSFRGTQHKDEKDRPFTESREIRAVDGRPAAKNQKLTGPFFFGGGFSSLLDEIFSARNAQYFHYKLLGREKLQDSDKDALVIRFETRSDQKKLLHREILGTQTVLKGKGKAWLDPESMNVARLELEYLDPPFAEGVLTVSVDYAPVEINGKSFWMPKTVHAEQNIPNAKHPVGGQYIAQYSNYHQFKVSVKIKY